MEPRDLFGNIIPSINNDKIKSGLAKIENGEYLFFPDFISRSESDLFLQKLSTWSCINNSLLYSLFSMLIYLLESWL